jgi:MFS family permease
VLGFSALATGLTLLPFAIAAATGAALLSPRLILRVPARWTITAGLVFSAAGLLPLAFLVAGHSGRNLALIIAAEFIEGIGTGIGGPPSLGTALRGVERSDAGAASAVSSAAGQLGSSVGAALLNTIAITATAGYLVGHPTAGAVAGRAVLAAATVHGYVVAAVCGVIVLLIVAIPIAFAINSPVPGKAAPAGPARN